jgi:hypothetical protein
MAEGKVSNYDLTCQDLPANMMNRKGPCTRDVNPALDGKIYGLNAAVIAHEVRNVTDRVIASKVVP